MALTKKTVVTRGRRTKDISGDRYGKYVVQEYVGKDKHGLTQWLCKCDCGVEKTVRTNSLRMGKAQSCGCIKQDNAKAQGMARTPEYRAYIDAKVRCDNPNDQKYSWYGARGIEFKFDSFNEFYAELGERPKGNYSLDRIDNDGNYEVGNVRWATKTEQMLNRRDYDKPWLAGNNFNAKTYEIKHPSGVVSLVKNMADFCRRYGLDKANLHASIKTGWKHRGYSAQHV